jgi:hypothetical protein
VEFKGERASKEGSKGDTAFYRRQKRQSLSERAMPENGCRGPAKLKEAAHLDTDYLSLLPIGVPLPISIPSLYIYRGSRAIFNRRSFYY